MTIGALHLKPSNHCSRTFRTSVSYKYGKYEKRPLVVMGIGFKGKTGDISEFEAKAAKWEKWYSSIGRETKTRRENNKDPRTNT